MAEIRIGTLGSICTYTAGDVELNLGTVDWVTNWTLKQKEQKKLFNNLHKEIPQKTTQTNVCQMSALNEHVVMPNILLFCYE